MATQDHGFERSSHVGSNGAELRLVGGAHPTAGVRQRLQPQVDNNFTLVFAFTKILDQLEDFAKWIGAVNYDMPIASLSTNAGLAALQGDNLQRRGGGIFSSLRKVQASIRPISRFIGILHPDKLQHAIGKVKPTVGGALAWMSVSRSFSKAVFKQPISHSSFRLNQYKDVIQLQIHGRLCRLFRHNEHCLALARLPLVIQFKSGLG